MSAFLFVALLLKCASPGAAADRTALLTRAALRRVDVDGEGDSRFFSFVVGALSVIPVALPVIIKVWLRLYGNLEARMIVKDTSWE